MGEISRTLARCIAARVQAERERDEALRRVGELEVLVEQLTESQQKPRIQEPSEN